MKVHFHRGARIAWGSANQHWNQKGDYRITFVGVAMDDDEQSRTRIRMMDIARKSSKSKKDHKSKKKDQCAVLMLQSTLSKLPEPPKKKNPIIQSGFQLSVRDLKGKPEETYTIIRLNSGTNYLANKTGGSHTFLVKIENYDSHNAPKQLKREILLLEELRRVPNIEAFKNHFPQIVCKGRVKEAPSTESFNFVIERFAQTSITNILHRFTNADTVRFARQTFELIRFLHEDVNWIHRNISPNAFRFGTSKHPPSKLMMFSFGYAVRFRQSMIGKPAKSPRKMFRRADATFMPRSYYHVRDFLPKDDLEMWLYLVVYSMIPGAIKWDAKSNDVTTLTMKEQFFCMDFKDEYATIPKPIQVIIKYIYKLDQKSVVDYNMIHSMVINMCTAEGVKCKDAEKYDFLNNQFKTHPFTVWKTANNEKVVSTPKKLKQSPALGMHAANEAGPDSNDPFGEPAVLKQQEGTKKTSKKPKLKTQSPKPAKSDVPEFDEMPDDENPFDMAAVLAEGSSGASSGAVASDVPNDDEDGPIVNPSPIRASPRGKGKKKERPRLSGCTGMRRSQIKRVQNKKPKQAAEPLSTPTKPSPPPPVAAPINETPEGEDGASQVNKPDEAAGPTGKTETVGDGSPVNDDNEQEHSQQFYDMTTTNSSAVSATVTTGTKTPPAVFSANKVPETKDDEDPKEEL